MSDPALGLLMLGLIVAAIMMGFPTAFTLMGLGMVFGYLAFWGPAIPWWDNRIFDLMVQRTYGVMINDTLLSVPLFVFMGYIMERAALVDAIHTHVERVMAVRNMVLLIRDEDGKSADFAASLPPFLVEHQLLPLGEVGRGPF